MSLSVSCTQKILGLVPIEIPMGVAQRAGTFHAPARQFACRFRPMTCSRFPTRPFGLGLLQLPPVRVRGVRPG
jgi:hypothetical protein